MNAYKLINFYLLAIFFSVASPAFARIGSGVNLEPISVRTLKVTTSADLDLIRKSGFVILRQPFDPIGYQMPDGALSESAKERICNLIDEAVAKKFVVILDIHPSGDFKKTLVSEKGKKAFINLLKSVAVTLHQKKYNESVLLEILNEPGIDDDLWWHMQGDFEKEVHAIDPGRFLVASGGSYSTIGSIVKYKPYAAKNIVYSFHYYSPMEFTHQGANWGSKKYKNYHEIPWPPRGIDSQKVNYQFNKEFFAIQQWANKYNVEVICGEFGVYAGGGIKKKDRLRYFKDITSAFKNNKIPWLIWQYEGGFGITIQGASGKQMDLEVLSALQK